MIALCDRKRLCSWSILAVAVIVAATTVQAELTVSLPGIAGIYDDDHVSGVVSIPDTEGTSDVHIVVLGSQVAGLLTANDGCTPFEPRAIGAVLAISFRRTPDALSELLGMAIVAAEDGSFTAELPLLCAADANGVSNPPGSLGGSFVYEFDVFPDAWGSCQVAGPRPVVTIESAVVYSPAGVGTVDCTWGAVKGLFR